LPQLSNRNEFRIMMGRNKIWSLSIVLIVLAFASQPERSQCQDVSAPSGANSLPKIDFEKYTLPNGLQVILHT